MKRGFRRPPTRGPRDRGLREAGEHRNEAIAQSRELLIGRSQAGDLGPCGVYAVRISQAGRGTDGDGRSPSTESSDRRGELQERRPVGRRDLVEGILLGLVSLLASLPFPVLLVRPTPTPREGQTCKDQNEGQKANSALANGSVSARQEEHTNCRPPRV